MKPEVLCQDDHSKISDLLVGRKVSKVGDDTLVLDDGVELRLVGNDGCGGCPSGIYDLRELNSCDNIITKVKLVNSPKGDDDPKGDGIYRIFVYANNRKVNLATFEGTDGNGYYGTGYTIHVSRPVARGVES